MTESINQKIWDERHRLSRKSKRYNKYPAEHIVSFIAKNYYKVPDRSTVRILDIGCGSGCNLVYLCTEGFKAYGIDHSAYAIEISRELLKRNKCSAELAAQSAISMPYDDDFFDACVETNSIHCNKTEDIGIIFNEIYRVLKPGGKFFGTLASDKCEEFGKGISIDPYTFDLSDITTYRGHFDGFPVVHFFSKEELEQITGKFSFCQLELNIYTLETGNCRHPFGHWFVELKK